MSFDKFVISNSSSLNDVGVLHVAQEVLNYLKGLDYTKHQLGEYTGRSTNWAYMKEKQSEIQYTVKYEVNTKVDFTSLEEVIVLSIEIN